MKRRVLIRSRMKGRQRGCDRLFTQSSETTKLVTTKTSWLWKHAKFIRFSVLWLLFTYCWFVLIYPLTLFNSVVDVKMVSIRKEKQQNKNVFSQLKERDTNFMIGQNNEDEPIESRNNMICRSTSSDKVSNPTQVIYPQVDIHTLEEIIVSKVRS